MAQYSQGVDRSALAQLLDEGARFKAKVLLGSDPKAITDTIHARAALDGYQLYLAERSGKSMCFVCSSHARARKHKTSAAFRMHNEASSGLPARLS